MEDLTSCEVFCTHDEVLRQFDGCRLSIAESEKIANLFKALCDPTRVRILYYLLKQPLCVCDLSILVGASQSLISNQLRILRQYKLVSGKKEGQQVIYSIRQGEIAPVLAQGQAFFAEH